MARGKFIIKRFGVSHSFIIGWLNWFNGTLSFVLNNSTVKGCSCLHSVLSFSLNDKRSGTKLSEKLKKNVFSGVD